MATLFDKAKTKAPKETKSESKKENVEILDPQFYKDLVRLVDVNKQIETLSAEAAILNEEAKSEGKKAFKKLYNNSGRYPGSFNVTAKQKDKPDATFMLIPVDNYIKIKTEERATYLNDTIGEGLVEEKTEFKFNSELLDLHGEAISKMIENSKLPDYVKENLIEATTTWKIKKGTIENFKSDENLKKLDIDLLVEEIQPIFQVKTVKVLS